MWLIDFSFASAQSKIVLHRKYIEAGFWNYQKVGNVKRLSSQTLAIFGLGRIGQAVAKRAQKFWDDSYCLRPIFTRKSG